MRALAEKESGMRQACSLKKKTPARSNRECARTIDNKQQPRPGGCESIRDHYQYAISFFFSASGGSLYNIRLADDGTVHPSRSRVFKPVKRMKNKQLMAEIPRSPEKRKKRRPLPESEKNSLK